MSDPVTSSLQASYAFGMSREVMSEQHVKGDAGSRGREGKGDFSANGTSVFHFIWAK